MCVLEPKVLERVKRKRRLSSCEDGSNTTGSSSRLSMFVQSALQQTPVEDGAGMSRHDNGRPRQSGSSSRKKQRLGMDCVFQTEKTIEPCKHILQLGFIRCSPLSLLLYSHKANFGIYSLNIVCICV